MLLSPELGDDSESHERVVEILGQALRGHRELDPWIAAHRIDRSVAAHEGANELGQPRPVPFPRAIRKAFGVCELAHQLHLAKPFGERVLSVATLTRRVVRDLVLPDMEGRIEALDQLDKVSNQLWIGVRETWRLVCQAAFGDEVAEQPDLTQLERLVGAEALEFPRDRDPVAGNDVMQWLPATSGEEWMVARNLDGTSA